MNPITSVILTKCYKSQEKFWFLSRILETTSPKFEGDSHLDPVCFGAVALHKNGVIIIPPTPKGGFKFINAKKNTPDLQECSKVRPNHNYIIFSLTTIISQAFPKSKSVLFKLMCFVSVLFNLLRISGFNPHYLIITH